MSAVLGYEEFLAEKFQTIEPSGIAVDKKSINPILFDFQKDIVQWSLKLGKSAIFADCGMGKTPMQLEMNMNIDELKNLESDDLWKIYDSDRSNTEVRNVLVMRNIGLVLKYACYNVAPIDHDEFYSQGCVYLIRSVEKFNHSLGFSFSTYAVRYIKLGIKALKSYKNGNGSRQLGDHLKNLSRIENECLKKNNTLPSSKYLSLNSGLDENVVNKCLNRRTHPSIYCHHENGDKIDIDVDHGKNQFDAIDVEDFAEYLMNQIEPDHRDLVHQFYFKNKSLQQIGDKFGITREAVRQRIQSIFKKLRISLELRGITYDG